ncbi:MAG: class I SAM-dependent methyltransferase [Solirubrobacteraceae bacterium]
MTDLPRFREHRGHQKAELLSSTDGARPEPYVLAFLEECRRRSRVRVLDYGCGRGAMVAWLLEHGWDAWGLEISPEYIEQGAGFIARLGFGDDRLRLVSAGSQEPFEPESFDVVFSDQVLEHVEDLDQAARIIGRWSRPGAAGLHIFPARRRPIEVHLKMPLVHWLPKGRPRRWAIHNVLRAGLGAPYFTDYSLDDRTEIYTRYSESETFYRTEREIARVFAQHRLACEFRVPAREKLSYRLPWLHGAALSAAAELYRHYAVVYMQTVRT